MSESNPVDEPSLNPYESPRGLSEFANTRPRRPLPRNVKLLGWASLLNDTASEMVYPLLPKFLIEVLKGTTTHLGVLEGFAESTASLLKLWSGGWSDRAGRRKGFVVFGYSAAALTRPLIGLIAFPWQLIALRIMDRIGKGIRTAPRDAMIADATEPDSRGRAFGFHRAMDHLGAALGPLLALLFLWIWPDQLRVLFMLAVVPAIFVVLIVTLGLRETGVVKRAEARPPLTLAPFDRNFRWYLLSLLIFTLGNSSDLFLLKRAEELGVSTQGVVLLWLVFHLVKSLGNVLAGRLTDRVGPRPMIWAGWFVYAAAYLAFAFANAEWQIWALFLVYGIFYSLTEPAEKTLVANLVGPERKGLAFGWFNLTIGIGALPANIFFGWLYQHHGPLAAFGSGAGLAFFAALLLLAVRPKNK